MVIYSEDANSFIENDLMYNLPWPLKVKPVRRQRHEKDDGYTLEHNSSLSTSEAV